MSTTPVPTKNQDSAPKISTFHKALNFAIGGMSGMVATTFVNIFFLIINLSYLHRFNQSTW